MSAGYENFLRNVDKMPLLRDRLRRNNLPRRVIVTGRYPRMWQEAKEKLAKYGAKTVAFYSPEKMDATEHLGLPILGHDDPRITKLKARMVVVGRPAKKWFSGAYPELHRCLWFSELEGKKRSGWDMPNIFSEYSEEIELLWNMLEHDPSSIKILSSILKSRGDGKTGYINISEHGEYDHPIVCAKEGDVCIDAGAFQGDTTLHFASLVGDSGRVYSLEPSPPNFELFNKLVAESPFASRCHSICAGVWNEPGRVSFDFKDMTGGSSKISENAEDEIEVKTIDQIVEEKNLTRLDLIKFDVEGVEKEALEGGKKSIEKYRPKLMVSMYHFDHDLFSLSKLLHNMLPNYQFYLGHHSYYWTETDLYCIPKERLVS